MGTSISSSTVDVIIDGCTVAEVRPAQSTQTEINLPSIDGEGRLLSPGFIDVHAHADNSPLLTDDDTSKIMQGVTTEINGNCGFNLAPINPAFYDEFRTLIDRIFPEREYSWHTYLQYADELKRGGFVTNFATLVGHNTIRIAAMGSENRSPDRHEMRMMEELVDEIIEFGALGFSTGLVYPPGVFSAKEEITRLASRFPSSAVYASHMRNESRYLIESINETIEIAATAGLKCHISHLKMADRRSPGRLANALELLDNKWSAGLRITQDIYPYTAASTMLTALLPPWAHEGGGQALLQRLNSPEAVEAMAREVFDPASTFENYGMQAGWDGIVIAATGSHRYEGQSVASIARLMGVNAVEAVATILREENLRASMIVHAMSEIDVELALAHPRTMIGTDGLPVGTGGRPHPRGYGSYPRILETYVNEKQTITLGEAIYKMTELPSTTFGLKRRGKITKGSVADLVLLDPDGVVDNSSFTQPTLSPLGIQDVFVNGTHVVRNGEWLGKRAGRLITADS